MKRKECLNNWLLLWLANLSEIFIFCNLWDKTLKVCTKYLLDVSYQSLTHQTGHRLTQLDPNIYLYTRNCYSSTYSLASATQETWVTVYPASSDSPPLTPPVGINNDHHPPHSKGGAIFSMCPPRSSPSWFCPLNFIEVHLLQPTPLSQPQLRPSSPIIFPSSLVLTNFYQWLSSVVLIF